MHLSRDSGTLASISQWLVIKLILESKQMGDFIMRKVNVKQLANHVTLIIYR